MKKVLILHSTTIPYKRQIPDQENYIWGDCQFVFDPTAEYDYVVGTTHKLFKSKVPKERCVLFLGEPPMIFKYKHSYLKQYGHVYGCHQDLVKKGLITDSFSIMVWMAGCTFNPHKNIWEPEGVTYSEMKTMEISAYNRMDKACIVSRDKSKTPGHKKRMMFIKKVLENNRDLVDVYGTGFKPIGDKLELYSRYKYVLTLENCQYHNYWTEKLADTYLAGAFPLYYGCPNISDYFSDESYTPVDINNYESTIETLKSHIKNSIYEKSIDSIKVARNEVLDHYNYFSMIRDIIDEIDKHNPPTFDNPTRRYIIKPQPTLPLWTRIRNRVFNYFK